MCWSNNNFLIKQQSVFSPVYLNNIIAFAYEWRTNKWKINAEINVGCKRKLTISNIQMIDIYIN